MLTEEVDALPSTCLSVILLAPLHGLAVESELLDDEL